MAAIELAALAGDRRIEGARRIDLDAALGRFELHRPARQWIVKARDLPQARPEIANDPVVVISTVGMTDGFSAAEVEWRILDPQDLPCRDQLVIDRSVEIGIDGEHLVENIA